MQLEQLRKEIQEYEKRVSESQSREKNLLQELEDFDREIGLRLELIGRLKSEKKRTEASMAVIKSDLAALQVEIDRTYRDSLAVAKERDALAALVSRRAVYAYKYLQRDLLLAILTSHTALQMLERQEYIKRISEADRANIYKLDQKNRKLSRISRLLSEKKQEKSDRLSHLRETAQYKESLIAEENSEAELLHSRRTDREYLLGQIRQDQSLLLQQISDKKLAADRIENLIRSLETQRENLPALPEVTWAPEVPFSQLKGKMNWPTAGKVVSKFGLQRHKKLETVTENPGIEIESKEETPVFTVCTGEVTKITWMRGYGNTVLVNHQDGYYTVYAHLGTIYVHEGQIIQAGNMIGRVGQSGSLEGPRLHFEVWAKREKQDPLTWLSKN